MVPPNWIGQSIGGRYQIDSLLGQGGMSAVYRATDPNLRRMVAVKLIHSHLSANPDFVNRFKEEAAAVARLRHPNIVQVFDFDSDDDVYYMVLEYLIGETLQARLKRLNDVQRFMPYSEVIRFCTQLCEAAGYAHKHELVHRDIKPANIMLDLNGQAILMDFGIVKIVGGDTHTATGATVGTAMYMSPEQIRSERVDERSDIYSLGVTLYEMISGQPPYQADSALTLMMMVLNDPLPDLRETRKGISEALARVVETALAKDQIDRFQTMDEMAAALQQAQEQLAGAASVVTVVDDELAEPAPAKELAETKDSPAKVESVDTSASEHEPKSFADVQVTAVPARKDPPVESVPAEQQVAPSQVKAKAKPNYRRIIIGVAALLLIGAAIAVGIVYFQSQKEPDLQLAPIDQPLAQINVQTAQYVVSLGRWEISSTIEELAFSPDGKLIGTANSRDSMRFSQYRFYGGLWRVDTGKLQSYLLGHSDWVYGATFSADGQLFASASDDGEVILWYTAIGTIKNSIETDMGGLADVEFSPNGLLLATGSWGGSVDLWQVNDGHLLRSLQGHENSVVDVEFSPDGKLLASASDDHTIRLWQVSDGSLLHTLKSHTAPVNKLAFSPDGLWVASASQDYAIGLWQVSDGSLAKSLLGHSENVYDVAFSADSSLLVSGSADATLRFWAVADGEMLRILTEHSDTITRVAFSPDGHTLVSGAADGVLRFWGLSEAIPLEIETPEPAENP